MLNIFLKYLLIFIVFALVQSLVLNNILFSGYINPYIYILFILMLPFETPRWIVLWVSFITGLTIDMFSNTIGMHAASCCLIGFCRPFLMSYISPREGYPFESEPSIAYQGLNWYLSYAGILVLLHHLCLFYIEVFRMSEFFHTMYRAVMSSCVTLFLMIIVQYLFFSKK